MNLEKAATIDESAAQDASRRLRAGGLAVLLIAATALAYAPSLRGGFLWDDPDYVVNNLALRSLRGLWIMWTNIFSLPQWYPMVHTTYWLEYHLFGLNPLVFRIDNLLLHIATALLLWRLLLRLEVPGAYLGALIFALHPVHVESVAWITERKNTLSGFFYVAAFLAYLRWRLEVGGWRLGETDPTFNVQRSTSNVLQGKTQSVRGESSHQTSNLRPQTTSRWYWIAFGLFLAALLSKTVTASFPAAMVVVIWWKTGRVKWDDVKPLVLFFAAGIVMGLITAYLERNHVGAFGYEWDYAPTWYGELAARTLIAGRALWFYAGKLIWPHPLAFMYERWTIDVSDWRQWIYPLAVVVLIVAVVLSRKRLGRGVIAALLLFGGTLFPALGYFNVFPHRYSFVADHFQHLASIALTSLLAAAIATAIARIRSAETAMFVRATVIAVIASLLAILSFDQTRHYKGALALWEDTAEKSPGNWVAFTNLGRIYADMNDVPAAIKAHRRAVELAPDVGDTWFNMGNIYATEKQWDSAIEAFNRARELAGKNRKISAVYLDATVSLGRIAFVRDRDFEKAEAYFNEALAQRPDYTPALVYLGIFYEELGRIDDAFAKYLEVLEADPNNFDARYNLGNILMNLGKYPDAAEQFSIAVANRPTSPEAWANFGWAQLQMGGRAGAIDAFKRALAINPQLEQAKKGMERATARP